MGVPTHHMAMRCACLLAAMLLPFAAQGQGSGWKIELRQVRLPAGNGDCAPIEIVVRDAEGKQGPMTPDGKQVDWQDFDVALTQGAGPLKLTGNGRFLCATAPGATGVVTAKYPESTYLTGNGKGRTGKKLIPGVTASATLEVRSAGMAPSAVVAASSSSGSSMTAAAAPPSTIAPVGTRAPAMLDASTPTVAVNTAPIRTVSMTTSATNVAASSTPGTPIVATGSVVKELSPSPVIETTIQPPNVELAGFTATGLWGPPPQVELASFAASGLWGQPPVAVLPGFTATGEFPPANQ